MKRSHILAVLFLAFAIQAAADQQEPAYWMKSYPSALQAKVDRCLVAADTAYAASINGGTDGVSWAVLAKGNAWETCMEGK